ncbi:MAG TPA: polyphosphate kinase 1 [Actinomycetota bacterium]|nr:polyphosphate kinase 1 [Actinomycetota bacterium]
MLDALPRTERFLNRELSWLEFDARVLALAEDRSQRLLERAKFLAIFGTNLDEFFQVRVAGLQEQREAGVGSATPEGLTPEEQLAGIRSRVVELMARADRLWNDDLRLALEKERVRIVQWADLDRHDREHLDTLFLERVYPVLTPLSVDPAHPFPYISSLSLNLAALVRDPSSGERRFARVKVPPLLPRFLELPDGERFVPIEQAIAAHLDVLFPGMEILGHSTFRLTRDADFELEEDEGGDLLEAIESVLRRRLRGATPVRLELDGTTTDEVRFLLMRELSLSSDEVYVVAGLLDASALWSLHELERPDLKDDPWSPVTQPRLADVTDFFALLSAGDLLVHHPYDSFETSVEAFIEHAAQDPAVLAIKLALYRTSQESPIVQALVRAAEAGKQVAALVELQARFDERANITQARTLEQAGVHVVYGVVGLKTHAKICLVVRREVSGLRRYAHVGTGNYNPSTARIYEDVGLLTADPDLGADLSDVFNLLTGYSRQQRYRRLLVAPSTLKQAVVGFIREEAEAGDGSIVLKVNSLVDAETIDALYEASSQGVEVDLIVRGICCLRPGVPGLSEHIRVRSIVGRYLEHSRILRFGSEDRGFRYFIGSADLMPRNLERRVEVTVPVQDPGLCDRLDEILQTCLADDVLAWELSGDGAWAKVPTERGVNAQERLISLAKERVAG